MWYVPQQLFNLVQFGGVWSSCSRKPFWPFKYQRYTGGYRQQAVPDTFDYLFPGTTMAHFIPVQSPLRVDHQVDPHALFR
jgi:hypothetical protein